MTTPEALTAEPCRFSTTVHEPFYCRIHGDVRLTLDAERCRAAERAARQPATPDTSGLREAAYEVVAWSVVEVGPGSYQCRVCRADVTDVTAPHGDDCIADALRAALAATERPLDEGCDCEPEHVWPCATIPRCDEPGCERETSCGFPSPTGYRRTCGEHYRAARLT